MKKIYTVSICIALWLSALSAPLSAATAGAENPDKISSATAMKCKNVQVLQENDSLYLSFEMLVPRGAVGKNESCQLIPMVQSPAGETEFPFVMLNGKRRAAFYKRERNFQSHAEYVETSPYQIVTVGKQQQTLYYNHSIPVSERIDGGKLFFYTCFYDCCETESFRSEPLLAEDLKKELERPERPVAKPNHNVTHIPALYEEVKQRQTSLKAYINFRAGKHDILPDFGSNRQELAKIDSALLAPITSNPDLYTIKSVRVDGYASPEGRWSSNRTLAQNRARNFWDFLAQAYNIRNLNAEQVSVVSNSEDWESLLTLIREGDISNKEQVISLLEREMDPDLKENKFKQIAGGVPYRYAFKNYYPLLRRLEISFDYEVKGFTDEEALRIVKTRPDDLSLYELYRVLSLQGMEQDSIYLAAAEYFPLNPVASINASSVYLKRGDSESAWEYLKMVQQDPRAFNNLGLYYMLSGDDKKAAHYLRMALDTDADNASRNSKELEGLLEKIEKWENHRSSYQYRLAGEE